MKTTRTVIACDRCHTTIKEIEGSLPEAEAQNTEPVLRVKFKAADGALTDITFPDLCESCNEAVTNIVGRFVIGKTEAADGAAPGPKTKKKKTATDGAASTGDAPATPVVEATPPATGVAPFPIGGGNGTSAPAADDGSPVL